MGHPYTITFMAEIPPFIIPKGKERLYRLIDTE